MQLELGPVAIDLVGRAEISLEAALVHRAIDHWVEGGASVDVEGGPAIYVEVAKYRNQGDEAGWQMCMRALDYHIHRTASGPGSICAPATMLTRSGTPPALDLCQNAFGKQQSLLESYTSHFSQANTPVLL